MMMARGPINGRLRDGRKLQQGWVGAGAAVQAFPRWHEPGRQRLQIIAALQHKGQPAGAKLVGQVGHQPGQHGEPAGGHGHLRQRIAIVGVVAGGHEN
jgi:hypothetical protein